MRKGSETVNKKESMEKADKKSKLRVFILEIAWREEKRGIEEITLQKWNIEQYLGKWEKTKHNVYEQSIYLLTSHA